MNKNQNPTTLKVCKPLAANHNATMLKVRKSGDGMIPGETALKVRKGLATNHNETSLKLRRDSAEGVKVRKRAR